MKGFDAFAGVIKSGGKTRRAAKMVITEQSITRTSWNSSNQDEWKERKANV